MRQISRHAALLIALALLAALLTACGGNTDEVPPAAPTAAPQADGGSSGGTTILVSARDFAFTLDKARVSAGAVTFTVTNAGPSEHDFQIRGNGIEEKTPMIEKGKSASFTVTLAPGTYRFLCTVPGHDSLGMRGALTVT